MERGRSILLMTTVIAALAVILGALWYRTGSRKAASAMQATEAQRVRGDAGRQSGTLRAAPLPGSADTTGAAAAAGTTAATGTANGAGPIVAADADQRQLAKITRGMSAAAAGGILVTATPPGSVTGQLRLREGDVIVAVNGEAISTPEDFARIYREQGAPRQLTIVRDGREIHRH
jgi:S1-C subfamily serine protease